jgi:Uma2 family endonuclease
MSTVDPTIKRWTRADYHDAARAGIFDNEKVELVCGEILIVSPMDARHATGIQCLQDLLPQIVPDGSLLRLQLPLTLGLDSEPEPDAAIVSGERRDFIAKHPNTAQLVVEVSSSSLKFDRGVKRRLYATHQIPEYWILNLKDIQLEVHRNPQHGDYSDVRILTTNNSIEPLACAGRSIALDQLLF